MILISRRVIASLDHVGNEIAKKERRHMVCKVFLWRIFFDFHDTLHYDTIFYNNVVSNGRLF